MSFSGFRVTIDYIFTVNGSAIDRVASNNNLSILFSADLNFHPRVEVI